MKIYEKITLTSGARKNCALMNNLDWLEKHEQTLQDIEDNCLPSGSGFDAGTKIIESTENKLVLQSAYHLIDDAGYYRQWVDFKIVVTPCLFGGIIVKAIGKFSALEKPLYGSGTRDYIEETFYNLLMLDYEDRIEQVTSE